MRVEEAERRLIEDIKADEKEKAEVGLSFASDTPWKPNKSDVYAIQLQNSSGKIYLRITKTCSLRVRRTNITQTEETIPDLGQCIINRVDFQQTLPMLPLSTAASVL